MESSVILNIIGISFNLIGTILISCSLKRYFKSIDNSFLAIEKSIESISDMLNNKQLNAFIIEGLEMHRKKGQKEIITFTFFGILHPSGRICDPSLLVL